MLSRTRYSFWVALGDIGGFFDGMGLLTRIFMGPLSAVFFFNNFAKGGHFLPMMSSYSKSEHRDIQLATRYPEDLSVYQSRLAPHTVKQIRSI